MTSVFCGNIKKPTTKLFGLLKAPPWFILQSPHTEPIGLNFTHFKFNQKKTFTGELFACLVETGSHVAQAGLELGRQGRPWTWNLPAAFSQALPSAGITGMHYHTTQKKTFKKDYFLKCVCICLCLWTRECRCLESRCVLASLEHVNWQWWAIWYKCQGVNLDSLKDKH
jgi:hypothetical protein